MVIYHHITMKYEEDGKRKYLQEARFINTKAEGHGDQRKAKNEKHTRKAKRRKIEQKGKRDTATKARENLG